MIIELIKWNKIKGKYCITNKCRWLGNTTKLQDAKDLLLENVDCRNPNPGSFLKFSPTYGDSWGVFCILKNETTDIVDNNPNWEYYDLKWEGKNSFKYKSIPFGIDLSIIIYQSTDY